MYLVIKYAVNSAFLRHKKILHFLVIFVAGQHKLVFVGCVFMPSWNMVSFVILYGYGMCIHEGITGLQVTSSSQFASCFFLKLKGFGYGN